MNFLVDFVKNLNIGNILAFFAGNSFHFIARKRITAAAIAAADGSLFAEGFAVSALVHCGVCFMSAYQNPIQRAVICLIAVICALGNGTFDTLICFAIHIFVLLFLVIGLVCTNPENPFYFSVSNIDNLVPFAYNSTRKTTNFQNIIL